MLEQAVTNYYDTLQVSPKASSDVIKAAYRALMKQHHPDANDTKGVQAVAINQAYETLADDTKRRNYDRQRRVPDPKIIGDYKLVSKIAEGGFGKTYKGEHLLTGQPVCIKHCSEISADSEMVLIEEAKAMWDLRHYAIPAVRNVVRLEDNSLALVMSYIPGPTLFQIVEKHKRLDAEHVAWIAQRILNALIYLHNHGVVHGDIKPQNVIVQPDTHTVVLVDFGLSMVKPKGSDAAKGFTEMFAPPEQMTGQVLIPESDLYSLGMTMIFALSGDTRHVTAREVPSHVPDALCNFVRRLVVRDPLSRPRVWQQENLCETIEQVRQEAFGRTNSKMKPLPL